MMKTKFTIKYKTPPDGGVLRGRASGTRTHGLFVPNEARYQLRYSPTE